MFFLSTSLPQFFTTAALSKTRNCCIAEGIFTNAAIPTHLTAIALSDLRAILDSKRWSDLSNLLVNQGFPSMHQCPSDSPILNSGLVSIEHLVNDASILTKYTVQKQISAVAAYACTTKRLTALYAACSSVATEALLEQVLAQYKEESAECVKWKSRSEILSNTIIAKLSESTSKRIAVEIGTDLKIEKEVEKRQQVELQLGIALARTQGDSFRITELENTVATLKTENGELQTRLGYSVKSANPTKTVEKRPSKDKQVAEKRSSRHLKPDLVVKPPSPSKHTTTMKPPSPSRPTTTIKPQTSPTQAVVTPTTTSAKQLAKFMDQSLSSPPELVKSTSTSISSSSSSSTMPLLSPPSTPRRPGRVNQTEHQRRSSYASSISSAHSMSAFQKGDSSASSSGTSSESEDEELPPARPRQISTLQPRPSSMVESGAAAPTSRKIGRRLSDTGLLMETSPKREAKGSKLKFSLVRQESVDKQPSFEKKFKSWFKDSRLG